MTAKSTRQKTKDTAPTDGAHRALAHDRPLDESRKSSHTILEQLVQTAEEELRWPAPAILLSGLAAGLDIGWGPFAMAVNLTLTEGVLSRPVQALLTASFYAIGFVFVVLGRSIMFTEQTTSAVLPVLVRRASIVQLLRLWVLVLAANVVGGALFAAAAVVMGPALGVVEPSAFGELARPLVDQSIPVMVLSAVAAGWLMGLLVWLSTAARETTSQIIVIWLVALVIGLGKLHHSVAGSIEVLMGVFAGQGAIGSDFGRFMLWVPLGNIIGGVLFVALLKFGSVQQSVEKPA
ncbi:MAG TPA: formate/nitrite transporter family protein [Gemmatimonadaceae bacterium]|nr:formate/nitrite transporter family protein [Gemmatimonadaceae bacterium]